MVAQWLEADHVAADPLTEDWVIVVRLWWEQTDADDVAMRARVTSTANGAIVGRQSAASTVEGVLAAVRVTVENFLENQPPMGLAHG